VFATDGSGQGGQAGWGLTSVRTTHEGMQADTDAGFDPEAAVREECGRVITNPNQAEHLGATRATNNTGELSAVHCGLPRADGRARAGAAGRGGAHSLRLADRDLHHDWRMGVAQEHGAGRAQQESPSGPTRADGTTVRFQHVRAHAGHGMNERADRLAAQGVQGMRSRGGRIYVPTDGDGRGHGSGVYAPPGGPGDLSVDSVPD
jgi:ribonuclease HI